MATAAQFNVFSNRKTHIKGKDAWRRNLKLTALAADKIRSSLGPNGAYKMVSYNRGPEKVVKITRDVVTVLEELAIQYPTLVVLSEAAKIQRQEIGDGVKSFVILTAQLLKRADDLVSKGVHPRKILRGYQEAAQKAAETIRAMSKPLAPSEIDSVLDSVDCGRGCLTPELRRMILDAKKIATFHGRLDPERIRIIRKPGGSQSETLLIRGMILKKSKAHPNMPQSVTNARIAVTNERIGINRLEVKMPGQGPFHMKYNITTPDNLSGFREAENEKKSVALARLQELGVNVLLSQQPIDDFSKNKLLEMGVLVFSSVDKGDIALVARATGALTVGNLTELEPKDIGRASTVETDKIRLEDIAIFTCENFATFMICGSTTQALDEQELLIENSTRLLQVAESSGKKVPGGGAIELRVAHELKDFALQFSGREQLAVDNFAEAVLEIPRCLAANNGLFVDDAVAQLSKLHAEGFSDRGFAADGSCRESCMDVAEVKSTFIRRAFEVVSLLLMIDEQIVAKEIPKFHKQ